MILTLYKAPAPATPVSFVGKYIPEIWNNPNVFFEFTDNRVNLMGGCNNQEAEYGASFGGSFNVNQFQSIKNPCSIDKDYLYINALAQSTNFVRGPAGKIFFKNSIGEPTLTLYPYVEWYKEIKFSGTYKPSINDDSDLLIKLEPDGGVSMHSACNNRFGNYMAFEGGRI